MNHPPKIIRFFPGSSVPISHAINDSCLSITSLTNRAKDCPAVGTAAPENPMISSGSDHVIWRMCNLFAVFVSNIKMLAPVSNKAFAYLSPASVLIWTCRIRRLSILGSLNGWLRSVISPGFFRFRVFIV